MNCKSSLISIIFSILIGLTLILSAVNPIAAYASAPSGNLKPPTSTPTPTQTVTETPVPTVTPIDTDPALSLSSDSTYIIPGGQVVITYQITDFDKITGTPTLRFHAPLGLTPADLSVGRFDDTTGVYDLIITESQGKIAWQADDTIAPPVDLSVELLQDDTTISTADVQLDALTEFEIPTTGGEADGLDGRVKVTFPDGALKENVKVSVTRPSQADLPVRSLSGSPFELTAASDATLAEVSKFSAPVQIVVAYPYNGAGDEGTTMLYWYDPTDGQWKLPLSQKLDTANHVIIATTDHFTVFDTYTSSWESAETPTMSYFQTPGFTGAASFSMPIKVPNGPGGLQPSLSLSYNSSTVDSIGSESQASWAGMGWSVGENYIELNTNGTEGGGPNADKGVDDTFQLNFNGSSIRLFKDSNGQFHSEDENFYKVERAEDHSSWTIWSKDGTKYTFADVVKTFVSSLEDGCYYLHNMKWKWELSQVQNIYGQTMDYTYATESKTFTYIDDCNGGLKYATSQTAIYPESITYAGGHYRIYFERITHQDTNHRADIMSIWANSTSYQSFQRSLVKDIRVEQDANGDGTFETLIREYVFTYCQDASCSIFPDLVWDAGGRTPTLTSVQEFGLNGTDSLPAYTFTYADRMHLTSASNGYGGSIAYIYNNTDNYTDSPQNAWHAEDGGNPIKYNFYGTTTDGWSKGSLDGSGHLLINYGNTTVQTLDDFQPGRWYILKARVKANYNSAVFNFGFSYKANEAWQPDDFDPNTTIPESWTILQSQPFFLPLNATRLRAKIRVNSGTVKADWIYVTPLPTYSRVTSRTLSTGSDNYTYLYTYEDPHTNDPAVSVAAAGSHPYDKPYTEFRGHSKVTEQDPYGNLTETEYYQDDVRKGRTKSVTTKDYASGLKVLQASTTDYDSSTTCTFTLTDISDMHDPLYKTPYDPLYCRFVYATGETKTVYKADGVTEDDALTTTYDTYDAYGNLTQKTQEGGGVTLVTHTDFFANESGWLVGLPARTWVTDGANLLTETLNLYDGANNYTAHPTVGIPTATRTLIDASQNLYSQTSLEHDDWGNVTSQTTWSGYGTQSSAPTEGARTSYTAYDPTYHTYAVTTTDALGHQTNVAYDYSLGLPLSETDPNGAVTSATYDSFGRFTSLTKPGDSTPTLNVSYQNSPFVVTLNQVIDESHTFTVTRHYDGLGRQTLTQTGTGTNSILVDSNFDAYGHVVSQSTPHTDGEAVFYTTTTYDALGRPRIVTAPDGTVTTTAYDGLTTTTTDAKDHSTTTVSDVWGRTLSVTPPTGPAVTFTYDALGNMLTAERGGATTTLTYDAAGHRLTMDDADMGFWQYNYDAMGNLTRQVDAKNQVICEYYDNLNRPKGKTYFTSGASCPADPGSGNYEVNNFYDAGTNGIGQRTSMSDVSGLTVWGYDARGRVVTEAQQFTGYGQYVTSYTYNSADLPVTVTYPDGETVTTKYNNMMLFDKLVNENGTPNDPSDDYYYVFGTGYDSSSRITSRALGNGLTQNYTYYSWNQHGGRLQNLSTGSLQNFTYQYDAVGNITSIVDSVNSQTQTFDYDALDRLWHAGATGDSSQGGYATETYSYDGTTGNLSSKAGVNYTYNSGHVHAASSLSNGNTYTYDSNGNMIQRNVGSQTFNFTYDAENRLVSVSGDSTATFIYNGDGQRIKSVMDGETTLFVSNNYEVVNPGAGQTVTKYYVAGTTRVALRKNGTLSYMLPDHLGSTSLVTDVNGNRTSELRYKPWGETRYSYGTMPTKYTFTGQFSYTDDPSTPQPEGFGLMYFEARWVDVSLGRFAQPDSKIPSGGNGQEWDRYAYSFNNPIKYSDPNGHDPVTSFFLGMVKGMATSMLWWDVPLVQKAALTGNESDAELAGRVVGDVVMAAVGIVETVTGAGAVTGGATACIVTLGGGCVLGGGEAVLAGAALVVEGAGSVVAAGADIGATLAQMSAKGGGSRNSAQDRLLTKDEIKMLEEAGYDVHELKGGKGASKYDLYVDKDGNIYQKPKGGIGPGEPLNININDLPPEDPDVNSTGQ